MSPYLSCIAIAVAFGMWGVAASRSQKRVVSSLPTVPCFSLTMSDQTPKTNVIIHDPVNHPSHYAFGEVECIDAIKSSLGSQGYLAYCQGQVTKYCWRWQRKNGLEDLRKAQFYLTEMIKELGA
jgi:hypothetical protein